MIKSRKTHVIFLFCLLATISLACSLLTQVYEKPGQIKSTAESLATSVKGGQGLLETSQALATQVLGSDAAKTAQALVTKEGPGLIATVQAFTTEEGPSLLATAQAFATQSGPGLLSTVQSFATEEAPGLIETAQAAATRLAGPANQKPADIPVVDGDKENLFLTEAVVSYQTSLDLNQVRAFYEQQMPANGWSFQEKESVMNETTAVMIYDKTNRRATLTLTRDPASAKTIVVISIQSR